MTPANGVRRSCEASARNCRIRSSACWAVDSAVSSASSIWSNATAVRPSSVSGRVGRSRRPRAPAPMRWASAVIRSSGRRATATTRISSRPVIRSAPAPVINSMIRSVDRVRAISFSLACSSQRAVGQGDLGGQRAVRLRDRRHRVRRLVAVVPGRARVGQWALRRGPATGGPWSRPTNCSPFEVKVLKMPPWTSGPPGSGR